MVSRNTVVHYVTFLGLISIGLIFTFVIDKLIGSILIGSGIVIGWREILKIYDLLNMPPRKPETPSEEYNKSIRAGTVNGPVIQINDSRAAENISEILKKINMQEKSTDLTNIKDEEIKNLPISKDRNEKAKELLEKIYDKLDSSDYMSIIAEMALRLAQHLKMKPFEDWLKEEVYGYDEYWEDSWTLKKSKKGKHPQYRSVEAQLIIDFKKEIKDFSLNIFFSQPLHKIEQWTEIARGNTKLKLEGPPLDTMVETLKIDPRAKVPYLIEAKSMVNIIHGFRRELNKFLQEAKSKIEKSAKSF